MSWHAGVVPIPYLLNSLNLAASYRQAFRTVTLVFASQVSNYTSSASFTYQARAKAHTCHFLNPVFLSPTFGGALLAIFGSCASTYA